MTNIFELNKKSRHGGLGLAELKGEKLLIAETKGGMELANQFNKGRTQMHHGYKCECGKKFTSEDKLMAHYARRHK